MSLPPRTLGLDVGDKTIGLAISDGLGITAQGLPTIRRESWKPDLAALKEVVEEREVKLLVIGLPLNMDGSEGPRVEKSREFGRRATEACGIPHEFWDERLTTSQVQRMLISADVSRGKRKKVVDMLAAQVILQSWLDARPAVGERPAP